jgi:hypothetical protein
MNEIEKLAEKALEEIVLNITDDVFLIIQSETDTMHQYIDLVSENGRDNVNQTIGKYVKNRLNLTNLDREDKPDSTLIQSYQKHGLPE